MKPCCAACVERTRSAIAVVEKLDVRDLVAATDPTELDIHEHLVGTRRRHGTPLEDQPALGGSTIAVI